MQDDGQVEISSASDDVRCACGLADRPRCRAGCDACERLALETFHASRAPVDLPAGWWRTFEPQWSCGAYYLFGRNVEGVDHHGRARSTIVLVSACQNGVSFEDSWDLDSHMQPSEIDALREVLRIATCDHLALAAVEDWDNFVRFDTAEDEARERAESVLVRACEAAAEKRRTTR